MEAKQKQGSELFYTDENGKRQDKRLWNEILDNKDANDFADKLAEKEANKLGFSLEK